MKDKVEAGHIKRYEVTMDFATEILGSAPSDPNIYASFIASKKAKLEMKTASESDKAAVTLALAEEELKLLPSEEEAEKGVTVFRRHKGGLILLDTHIRGFLCEAGRVVGGFTNVASKIIEYRII
jgi:hypothetical protein